MQSVAKFPALRLVEKPHASEWHSSPLAARREYALILRDSVEAELSAIKSWAPEGAYLVYIEGRKVQKRWPDPVKKDRDGNPRVRSTTKFNLKDWPEMERNRADRYRLLAELKDINELLGRHYL
jgi:hypothetical protein